MSSEFAQRHRIAGCCIAKHGLMKLNPTQTGSPAYICTTSMAVFWDAKGFMTYFKFLQAYKILEAIVLLSNQTCRKFVNYSWCSKRDPPFLEILFLNDEKGSLYYLIFLSVKLMNTIFQKSAMPTDWLTYGCNPELWLNRNLNNDLGIQTRWYIYTAHFVS